jgi:arylsulfatase A-like enzyme
MMDVFPTVLAAANVAPPKSITLDGRDLLPVLNGKSEATHEFVFGHQGAKLATIRDARWKLHVLAPNDRRDRLEADGRWIDPRGPDGVTIIAQHEQAQPKDYPGLRTGDAPKAMMLFDLSNDPGEQRDVAAQHLDVVARLKTAHEQMNRDVPIVETPAPKEAATKKQ